MQPDPPVAPESAQDERCVSCKAELSGPFCARCGERRLRADEFSVRRLVADALQNILNLDTNLWRSLKLLVLRPGESTVTYMSGRRTTFLGPVQLFLLANLVYFLVQPLTSFNGYNTPLSSHMSRQLYSTPARIRERIELDLRERIDARVAEELSRQSRDAELTRADSLLLQRRVSAVEEEAYPTRFDARGEVFARALVFLIVPMLVAVLAVIYFRSGTPLVQHVVFAIHFHAWNLLVVSSAVLFALGHLARIGFRTADAVFSVSQAEILSHPLAGTVYFLVMEQGAGILVLAYLYLALRRTYGDGRLAGGLRAVALVAAWILSAVAYRFVLFWTTYWTM